jgi:hypothetical protein
MSVCVFFLLKTFLAGFSHCRSIDPRGLVNELVSGSRSLCVFLKNWGSLSLCLCIFRAIVPSTYFNDVLLSAKECRLRELTMDDRTYKM